MSYLNYEPDILERIDVLAKNQDSRKKIFDEISQILSDRAKLEEFYARSLERLCEGLSKIKVNNNESLKQIIQVIQTLFSSQAEQSQTFGSSISNDIIPNMKDIFKDDVYSLKNMQKIGERHEKELIKQVQGFDKMRKQYIQMSQVVEKKLKDQQQFEQQLEQHIKVHQKTQDINIINQLKKRKQDLQNEQKVLECMNRQKINSEQEMQNYIQKYNQYIDEYFLDVARIEDQIQNEEIQKRDQMKDCIMKYLVFKISLVRNIQYDVDRITTKLEEIDTKQNIKQYVNDLLSQYRDYKNNGQIKPLLCKLNFDNYKQFIDMKMAHTQQAARQQNANPHQNNHQHNHHHQHNLNQNNAGQANAQIQMQEQKARPKIFTQQNLSSIPPLPQPVNNSNNIIPNEQLDAQQKQKRPHSKIFQVSNMVVRKVSNEISDNNSQLQKANDIQQQQALKQEEVIQQNQQIALKEKQGSVQQEQQQDGRLILVKTSSQHIKQPTEYKYIDIMNMMKQKQLSKQKELKGDLGNKDETHKAQEVLEIETEDLFEYILLKIWNNNELQSYDVDQLRSILERDSSSRMSFSNYFCNFFGSLISDYTKKLIAEEKDIVNRLLLERGKVDICIEISSDTYTYLMRILYCVLDILNSCNDLHFISDIYRTSKSIFKVIRPPDEDIKSFERIFLNQGLSGHQLFQNQNHWQNKLKLIVEQLENLYEQRVRNQGGVSDTEEIKAKKSVSDEKNINSSMNELNDEGQYLYSKLLISIRDLFEFEIPKEKIAQIVQNLVEEAILTQDVAKYLIIYINQYEKKEIAVMQSEELAFEDLQFNQNQKISNLQQQDDIQDFQPSSNSSSEENSFEQQEIKEKQISEQINNDDIQEQIQNEQTQKEIGQEDGKNINQKQEKEEFDDEEDTIKDLENKYAEGLQ
ncbi:Fes/CIP4-like domain protein (macronuclear) [Tetrahymena thermophila SB210]|uniref:Fes/CIP4-like domain protein n=1 Tax=Tetrahymena thermophila (strain SB210) TaxID=312017 RepID=I7M6J9_TETTS|nr:Fes/CIP4-like domain protein [Tetrahymena thermophila SB210]EAR85346.1 Fes/CIP4-like domain protein [Tetrahymena thermophila SB210]|eukprot:XP_001033009.1 Fes/CIP4-like domain protein [Tetrahymena thermophila SB210]